MKHLHLWVSVTQPYTQQVTFQGGLTPPRHTSSLKMNLIIQFLPITLSATGSYQTDRFALALSGMVFLPRAYLGYQNSFMAWFGVWSEVWEIQAPSSCLVCIGVGCGTSVSYILMSVCIVFSRSFSSLTQCIFVFCNWEEERLTHYIAYCYRLPGRFRFKFWVELVKAGCSSVNVFFSDFSDDLNLDLIWIWNVHASFLCYTKL